MSRNHKKDHGSEQDFGRILKTLLTNQEKIMALLDQLTKDVAAETDIDNSTLTLIDGLVQEIKNAGTDPVALKALTDKMESNAAALSAAVTANTTGTGSGPNVTAVSPANGSVNGGETITLTGSGFTGATAVNFGNAQGTNVVVSSDTSLTVVSPAQAASTVDITVVTPKGTSAAVASDKYTLA